MRRARRVKGKKKSVKYSSDWQRRETYRGEENEIC